jgi:hypothetical protein
MASVVDRMTVSPRAIDDPSSRRRLAQPRAVDPNRIGARAVEDRALQRSERQEIPPARPVAGTSYRVLTSLASATYGFDQLLKQLRDRLELIDTSKTYNDRRDRHPEQTVAEVTAALNDALAAARVPGRAPVLVGTFEPALT